MKEPNKRTGEKGSIYVWATDLNRETTKSGWQGWKGYFISFQDYDTTEPRSYRLPYSVNDHKKADQALGMLKGGKKVGGRTMEKVRVKEKARAREKEMARRGRARRRKLEPQ